jgi:hypothetical protein
MIGSTKRLERIQIARYGERPDFQAYIRRVPVLVPYVPVYSLLNLPIALE